MFSEYCFENTEKSLQSGFLERFGRATVNTPIFFFISPYLCTHKVTTCIRNKHTDVTLNGFENLHSVTGKGCPVVETETDTEHRTSCVGSKDNCHEVIECLI